MYHKRYTNRPQALSDAPSDAGGGVGSVGGGGVGGVGVDVAPIGVASKAASGAASEAASRFAWVMLFGNLRSCATSLKPLGLQSLEA